MLAGLAVGAELGSNCSRRAEIALAACSSAAITARTFGQQRLVARSSRRRRRSIRAWRSARSRCSRSRAPRAAVSSADDLHAASGVRPVVGRGPPTLDRRRDPPLLLARLVALVDRGAVRRDRPLGLGLGARHRLAVALERGAGRVLGLHRGLARPDQRVAAVALGEHALLADRRRLAELARAATTTPGPTRVTATPSKPIGQPLEALDHPHVARAGARASAGRIGRSVDVLGERLGSVVRRGARSPASRAPRRRTDAISARPPSAPARSSSAPAAVRSRDHRRAQPPVERGRDRELVARVDLELVGQHGGAARRGGLAAQELVARRRARRRPAPPRGARPRPPARRSRSSRARLLEPLPGLLARGLRALDVRRPRSPTAARGGLELALELGELARQLGLAVALEPGQRLLELGDAGVGLRVRGVGERGLAQAGEALAVAAQAALEVPRRRTHRIGAVGDPIAGGLGQEAAPRQLLAMGAPPGQRLLGRLAAAGDGRRAHARPARARARAWAAASCAVGELGLVAAQIVAGELPPRLERLALEPRVQLGGLGLALERAQARARLALDVERSVEVVLGARELQLRPAPALAVLAESGGLLDQQPAVARLGGHDRLDPALGDDRVHLLAEAGVRQQLDHVDQPAARAGEPVLALAVAVEPAHDRDLGRAEPERALAVVEHELDLGAPARLAARGTAEDHVLHRLPADGERRLLAERPQHRVGDVRLARSVRSDDHADAGAELEPGAVREGLEALERDRFQVHGRRRSARRQDLIPAPPAPPARPPARRPSCSGLGRGRPRRRRSSR